MKAAARGVSPTEDDAECPAPSGNGETSAACARCCQGLVGRDIAPSVEETFRRLTIGDAAIVTALSGPNGRELGAPRLDELSDALLRIGALIALDAPASSYRAEVDAAMAAGARLEELLAVLLAVAGPVGSAKVFSAAPRIALAAGYDVEEALEAMDPAGRRDKRGLALGNGARASG